MEQVQEATDQARQKVQEAGGQAKQRAREQVDQRSTDAGERVSAAAGDARSVAEELRKQGKERPAELAEQAAERAERVGGYLKDADADRILGDVEDFGRRQPWAVVAGGLALGFIASRFLKASSRDRYQASRTGSNGHTANGTAPRQELVSQQLAETPPATLAPRGPVDELAPRS
ncbi:MAG TPA: hypothetical protein VJU60_04045 [Thermoleophilaceae bacterium]|nr:hypothetical protein [Thermoleophilaceae bacterium]